MTLFPVERREVWQDKRDMQTIQGDSVGREVGGGIGMGNTCKKNHYNTVKLLASN